MNLHPRVLAVEDDPDLSYLYDALLSGEGYEVLLAHDADEALEQAKQHPDVIILDLMLPGTNGYVLIRRLRADATTCATPVVIVSAAIPPGRQRIEGADAIVHKPFEFEGLLRTIEQVSHHPHVAR